MTSLEAKQIIEALASGIDPGTGEVRQRRSTTRRRLAAGTPVAALARAHDRSAGAITSRLIRLGRLQVSHKRPPS
jgi:hypothetical protein